MKTAFHAILLVLLLSGCRFRASFKSGNELKGEGITFLVQSETSTSSQGTGGISYDSATVKAKTDGRRLTVNGKDHGALAPGDRVDLRKPGRVLVNGTERKPATP